MSTVMFADGILYADTQVTNTSVGPDGKEKIENHFVGTKLFRCDNRIFGVTGSLLGANEFFNWTFSGRPCQFFWPFPYFDVMVYEWDGKVLDVWFTKRHTFNVFGLTFEFSYWKHRVNERPMELKYIMGSGQDACLEGHNLGLTPVEAIQYASDRDPYTNHIIEKLSIEDVLCNHILNNDSIDEMIVRLREKIHYALWDTREWLRRTFTIF